MARFQSEAMKYEIKPTKLRKSRANEESIGPSSGNVFADLGFHDSEERLLNAKFRMAMRYTHAMEDAKRRAVDAIAVGTKNASEAAALPVSPDHSVTNEKPVADQIAVTG